MARLFNYLFERASFFKQMRHCHKTSSDPAKHLGPFEHENPPYIYQDEGHTFESEKCAACGNTVIRPVPNREPKPN